MPSTDCCGSFGQPSGCVPSGVSFEHCTLRSGMPTLGSVKPLLYEANTDQPGATRQTTPKFGRFSS